LVARLLSELATARAAIAASYLRLWRPAERSLREAGGVDQLAEGRPDPDAGAPDEHPPRDAA
jgi:hypothetical protein